MLFTSIAAMTLAMAAKQALAAHYFDSLNRVHLKMNPDNRFVIM